MICSMDPSTQLHIIQINESTHAVIKGIRKKNSTSSEQTILLGERPAFETVQCLD